MILWLSRYIPYILILLAGLAFLAKLYFNRGKISDVSPVEAVKRFFGRRLFVCILLSAAFLACYSVIKYCYNSKYPTLYISFNYENAAKGKNLNGTRFNASEILSDEVIEEVISRGGYSVSVDDLMECLSLETNYDYITFSSTMSESDLSNLGIATDYRIAFRPNRKTAGINGRTLLSLIGDVYYEKFMGEKTENTSILDLDFSDYDSSEYHSIAAYLKVKADALQNFIDSYSNIDSNYRGAGGDTFAALSGKIQNFSQVELERLDSYVVENGLSRDASDYSDTIDYKNKLLKLDYDKDMASYGIRLETIDMYDHQMARIVLVPTQDDELEYYMSRTKIGVDDYADEAQQYLEDAKQLKNEMDDNAYAQYKVNSGAATEKAYTRADEFAGTLIEELKELSEECKSIVKSYNAEKKAAMIQTGLSSSGFSSLIDAKKGIMLAAVFGALLCAMGVCDIMYANDSQGGLRRSRWAHLRENA